MVILQVDIRDIQAKVGRISPEVNQPLSVDIRLSFGYIFAMRAA
jgi:hypothetical protein